ncbi:XRE family transcriptional regulator [Carnobacterium maltaromaticum]|uniref:XRE family transcriptional regulator n=1 Tax=Carnobacterium maltaromaticum TaxID=2751 RepID=UPI0039BE321E
MENDKKRRRPPYKELMAWMILNDVERKDFMKVLNLKDATLSHRLNGTGSDFTPSEIRVLVKTYGKKMLSLFYFDE